MFEIVFEYFGVVNIIVFLGLSVNGFINVINSGIVFVMLDDFVECMDLFLLVNVIVGVFNVKYVFIQEVFVVIFLFLLVMGLGIIGGFCL